jgi:predicted helicase
MTTIAEVLADMRARSTTTRELGDRFEVLMVSYLKTDPLYQQQFSDVWLWMNWTGREGKTDTGIDLVAKDREGDGYCAIQCKFYEPEHHLQKADLDSFFTASGKRPFTSRIIISTTDLWSKHGEDALSDQRIPVTRLRVQDLDQSAVDWGQFSPKAPTQLRLKARNQLRPHQIRALDDVLAGFEKHERGKLIMACGTGKTFTTLKIAERLARDKGVNHQTNVLFLVPSISLISQTLREWTTQCEMPLRSFAVCSDPKVGKRSESEDISTHDLALPATTDPRRLLARVGTTVRRAGLTVIFSTYQSIAVVAGAQEEGLAEFDLIVCDEAHRTTGVTLAGEDESAFVRIHDQSFVKSRRRLYMTATPRLYDDITKSSAAESSAVLCSMDDEALYGPEFHRLGFGKAVSEDLLSDYKVLILTVDEKYVARSFQSQVADENNEIKLDDAVKIIGCWNGLAKRSGGDADGFDFASDASPMRRAVAFSRSIRESELLTRTFNEVLGMFDDVDEDDLRCTVEHVDGKMNALLRNAKLDWLRGESEPNTCRILSNCRCLSEGIDVPSLDAVLFLNPRNSVVDVVQSVGRVMRKSPGKQYGYIILPVGIPSDVEPAKALSDNKRYKVIWQVLQALRAHDDRFNATINKIDLNKKKPDNIMVGTVGYDSDSGSAERAEQQMQIAFGILAEEWRDAIYAKIVTRVGERTYWEDWARDVSAIASRHRSRIKALLDAPGLPVRSEFEGFLQGLRQNLNESITEDQAIDMLSQHLITKPVFDALFEDYSFAQHNPVSQVMQKMVDALDVHSLEAEIDSLRGFYESVRMRAEGIDNAVGRQKIITELYEKFFKLAFPITAESLGIVYTPVELVDFIIKSVEATLRSEFDLSLADKDVHVLDPFTGTGTFIVRLLQSGLIEPSDLARKYANELHANEIVLLAYYIAAINIEATYHDITGSGYQPFEGIVLTDTFRMSEGGGSMDDIFFPENNERIRRQQKSQIRVILGNPPYSFGQANEKDDNKNLAYPVLDSRIRATYAARSSAGNSNRLYDSYIRAFRLASDRIGDRGIVGFVSNGSFIDSGSADGFRRTLCDEFSSIYCFNLRGNTRTSGEVARKEGGQTFGPASRTPIAITLLVKNPAATGSCRPHYHDIGDYLSREQKLEIVDGFGSIEQVPWQVITPDSNGDWVNLRSELFESFTPLGAKTDKTASALFRTYSMGVNTGRDAWVYNFSHSSVSETVNRMIDFYNEQTAAFAALVEAGAARATAEEVGDFIDRDPKRISWAANLREDLRKGKLAHFRADRIVPSMYRPYCKQWIYMDRQLNERVYQLPRLFPTPEHRNLIIVTSGAGSGARYSVLVTDEVPNLTLTGAGSPTQCFPLYWYQERGQDSSSRMFDVDAGSPADDHFVRRDAITDWALATYQSRYGEELAREDIFFYVYGILHSPEYKVRFAADLGKMIPRIPMVEDFWGFSEAGRKLAALHLGYESAEPYPVGSSQTEGLTPEQLRVTKMRFGSNGDRTTIVYNSFVTLSDIPLEAYEYEVNGRSAIEWIVDRYRVKVDKDSGILNDPNEWSEDPRYVLDLVKRIVTVSIGTVKIVGGLPALSF